MAVNRFVVLALIFIAMVAYASADATVAAKDAASGAAETVKEVASGSPAGAPGDGAGAPGAGGDDHGHGGMTSDASMDGHSADASTFKGSCVVAVVGVMMAIGFF